MPNNSTYPQTQYSRRKWLQLSALAAGAVCMPGSAWAGKSNKSYHYHLLSTQSIPVQLPAGKSIPFDWPVAQLTPQGSPATFNWFEKMKPQGTHFRFRITSATDVREECELELSLKQSGTVISKIDVRFAHYLQPFEVVIHSLFQSQIATEGLSLKMVKGNKPFWFFISSHNSDEIPDAYLPHLLESGGILDSNAWKKRLLSLASLSTFGWMEGCVLDGISTMALQSNSVRKVLKQHLNKYFANNSLVYENLNNERSLERISTVESILPFAMLAMQNPEHPMLQKAIDFCTAHADATGVIADETGTNRRLKSEECYTISYPLAILAKKLNKPELLAMSIVNLEARVKLLTDDSFIYQNGKELEKPVYANWARGAGWYLLGLAKTLSALPESEKKQSLITALQQGVDLVIRHQQPNGLWACFLHQPETGIETSGSAVIAAAIAYGCKQNLLAAYYKAYAENCFKGLQTFFTPDGYLTGTAQVNKGGEALQRNGFRVISPYTLGFMGILSTSLHHSST